MTEQTHNKRSTDAIREDIDQMLRNVTTEEGKETIGVFLRMYEELREISKTLHQQNEQARRDSQSITDILKQHEKRMGEHENAFLARVSQDDILRATQAGRNGLLSRLVTLFSGAALAFSIGAFWKFIAVEKSFDRISALEKTTDDHGDRLFELEKAMINEPGTSQNPRPKT
jgi:hypothetical protein